ncbi:50S ribosomal protein L15 [Rubripirellula obstinata]|uniref:50S ribosomal protein L15 n=1 Tax=Rubripirellula obstinata TaxID=406547 RepID=A0A5B1C740_9BACT|nr:50S ribosomal protein L15 [Rubripirellula obstinata]
MPMIRRIPKRGFTNRWAADVFAVNVGRLNDCFNEGEEVTLELLSERDLRERLTRSRFLATAN